VLIISIGALFFGCARDYVTGKRTFSLVSESQEIAIGKESDPAIMAEFGLYEDRELGTMVNEIGQKLARVSHRPNLQFTFRLVDSPVVNAFALPGGYVYFTRGILAHFNSEAELAGVMGHEIGHVTARHGAEQQTKAQLAGLGFGLASVLSEGFRRYGELAQTGLGLFFLKYSRDNESESDQLGVEYSTKAGYDAMRMSRFFRTIARIGESSGSSIPAFLSTHPNPVNREQRVAELTKEWQQKFPGPGGTDRAAYLRRIDGIVLATIHGRDLSKAAILSSRAAFSIFGSGGMAVGESADAGANDQSGTKCRHSIQIEAKAPARKPRPKHFAK
jgi:predicted Zn-dependent protease